MSSKNGKAQNTNRIATDQRLDLLQKQIDQLMEQQTSTETKHTTIDSTSSFVQAMEFMRLAPQLVQNMMEGNMIRVKIDTFPRALVRVLVDVGIPCDKSRREAVRQYVELYDDYKRHQNSLSRATGQMEAMLEDSVARWERQLKHKRQTLSNLGVTIEDVPLGTTFDAELHSADPNSYADNGTVDTDSRDKHDTLAAVYHPLFTWKDENGVQQCVPADVTVYTFKE